jgi:hypothetical protein
MKHRDAYTLVGGKNMQQTRLGRTVRCLMAVFVVVCSLALVACPGGDEEVVRDIDARVAVNDDTVQAVEGQQIAIPNGNVFNAGPDALTLTFDDTGDGSGFVLNDDNGTASGDVDFGSCTFTVAASTFDPGTGPQVGDVFDFPTCQFRLSANDVVVDGDEVVGTLILILIRDDGVRVQSEEIAVEIRIDADGNIIVNDVDTGIDTDVTGTTGTTGG